MICSLCGAELSSQDKFCISCGAPVQAPAAAPAAPAVSAPYEAPVAPAPKEVKLLGPWAYFGLKILFSIPLVGFILLIVFSLDNSHLNRRNFARSYWCDLILSVVLSLLLVILLSAIGVFQELFDLLNYAF